MKRRSPMTVRFDRVLPKKRLYCPWLPYSCPSEMIAVFEELEKMLSIASQ